MIFFDCYQVYDAFLVHGIICKGDTSTTTPETLIQHVGFSPKKVITEKKLLIPYQPNESGVLGRIVPRSWKYVQNLSMANISQLGTNKMVY